MDPAADASRAEARTAAGILRLLMATTAAAAATPGARGMMLVQFLSGDGGDLFSDGGVPPASKAAIAALKEVEAEGDCAICLDAFDAGKEMPCGHRFHGACLDKWLGVHGSCPFCRSELPKAEEEQNGGGEGQGQGPGGAVLLTFLVMGGPEGLQEEEYMEEEPMDVDQMEEEQMDEDPWNTRMDDLD